MSLEWLSIKEYALLSGCSVRQAQRLASTGKICVREELTASNRKKFMVSLAALDTALQTKYYQLHRLPLPDGLKAAQAAARGYKAPARVKSLEEFTEAQRREISVWIEILGEWQRFRAGADCKAQADRAFVERCHAQYAQEPHVSLDILYRKRAAYRAGDLDGLIDRRGLWKKGVSSIDETVWRVFLTYYLDQAQLPVTQCVKYTQLYLREKQLSLAVPHESSFRRRIATEIPKAVRCYEREGAKALHDRHLPYIRRLYDTMQSNDYWVADTHTFDFMSTGENGRAHRLYLTAYLDARSTAFMGWVVTCAPCADATIAALRDAIETRRRGLPTYLYVDNGSEFLVHDIGGRGHRTRNSQRDQAFQPPPVLARLGITMLNAIPGNPEAKIIERMFLDVKNQFSRLVESFCGGSIAERPERLRGLVKSGGLPADEELTGAISDFLEGYYNHLPYNGAVKKDHGKPKIQVYEENLLELRRPANADDLNLLLMRSSRPVKVGRRGVRLNIAGFQMDYWTEDFLEKWQGRQVYYRYDPADLNTVRVYTPEDQLIGVLPVDNQAVLEYGAACADIKAGMRKVNRYSKQIKEWTGGRTLDQSERISAYVLVQLEARRLMADPPDYGTGQPRVVRLVCAGERPYEALPAAAGELTQLDTMIHNAKRFSGPETG